ncbi:MAG: NAD-dependent epimerase/dehydratase family protein [Pseudomonadota bacterium]
MTEGVTLITGAGGALARRVVKLLSDTTQMVGVEFRRNMRVTADLPVYQVDFHKRGFEDVFKDHTVDTIIHLGRFEAEESTPESRYNANVVGSQRLFDLAVKYKVSKVIVLSTFYVYGASPYNPALLNESAPLKASGLSKDLVDAVELANLSNIYLWKYPKLNMTILRPCHIVGPGVRNSMSLLLEQPVAPVLFGFSPMMQFIHIDDMARAITLAFKEKHRGVYNVAPEDWIAYQDALEAAGCARIPIPSIPPLIPNTISKILRMKVFPAFLINFFKYPVIIDGSEFEKKFGFKPKISLNRIFSHYRERK